MTNPNDIQHGGDHYKSDYQPWDFMADLDMGYFEGCAVKYVARYLKKNKPIEDLQKAQHYMQKALSLWITMSRHNNTLSSQVCRENNVGESVDTLAECNGLDIWQSTTIHDIALWQGARHLHDVIKRIGDKIELHIKELQI